VICHCGRRSERNFLVMINMNKLPRLTQRELFTERMRALQFFSNTMKSISMAWLGQGVEKDGSHLGAMDFAPDAHGSSGLGG